MGVAEAEGWCEPWWGGVGGSGCGRPCARSGAAGCQEGVQGIHLAGRCRARRTVPQRNCSLQSPFSRGHGVAYLHMRARPPLACPRQIPSRPRRCGGDMGPTRRAATCPHASTRLHGKVSRADRRIGCGIERRGHLQFRERSVEYRWAASAGAALMSWGGGGLYSCKKEKLELEGITISADSLVNEGALDDANADALVPSWQQQRARPGICDGYWHGPRSIEVAHVPRYEVCCATRGWSERE